MLDACCGSKSFWFDKDDIRALFIDKRRETHPIDIGTPATIGRSPIVVDPDVLADFSALPFSNNSFSLVVFDPPHIERQQALGVFTKKYGILSGDWKDVLRRGFAECFRVLKPHGTLIFKWAESDHPVSTILELTDEKPLFGHKSAKKSRTHWVVFMKNDSPFGDKAMNFDDWWLTADYSGDHPNGPEYLAAQAAWNAARALYENLNKQCGDGEHS